MKLKSPFFTLFVIIGALSLSSCASVDPGGEFSTYQRFKPLYAASYDDTGRALACAEGWLVIADPTYLSIESRGKQFAYLSNQSRRFGVAQWQVVSGVWQQDPTQLKATDFDLNKVPPEVKQCINECKQFNTDMGSDQSLAEHNGLAVAFDKAGDQQAGGALTAVLGGLAGIAGGGSGMQVANAVVPIGANQAIDSSSSQSDIQQAVATSASALEEKYGPEYSKMKGTLEALIRKYALQYPDLVAAIATPVSHS